MAEAEKEEPSVPESTSGPCAMKYKFFSNETPYVICVTQSFIEAVNMEDASTEVLTDGRSILKINWTQGSQTATSAERSKVVISEWKTICATAIPYLLRKISKDVFQPLRRDLVDDIHSSCGARLLAVQGTDLTYVFWHPDDESLKKMITEKGKVCKCFQRIYSGNEQGKLGLKITVSVKRDVGDLYGNESLGPFEQNVKGELNEIRETVSMMYETLLSVVHTLGELKARTLSNVQCSRPETVGSEDDDSPVKASSVCVDTVAESDDKTEGATLIPKSEYEKALNTDLRRRHEHSRTENARVTFDQATSTDTSIPVQDAMLSFNPSDTEGNTSRTRENISTQEPDAKGNLQPTSSAGIRGEGGSADVEEQNIRLEKDVTNHPMLVLRPVHVQSRSNNRSTNNPRDGFKQQVAAGNLDDADRRAIVIAKHFEAAELLLDALNISNIGDAGFIPTIRRLTESVALALEPPSPTLATSSGQDTMLCLDISESLGEAGFQEVKTTALKFLNDIEDMAQQYNVEENIGLVVMGGRPRVVHPLTNDYGAIREAIDGLTRGGKSPIVEAICVCIAALKTGVSRLNTSGLPQPHPRVIFFTDGQATGDEQEDGPDQPTSEGLVQHQIVLLCDKIKRKTTMPPPIWVPVGNANKIFLRNLSSGGSKTLVEPKDIGFLSSYHRIERTAADIRLFMENEGHSSGDDGFLSYVIDRFTSGMTNAQKARVKRSVKEKMQKKLMTSSDDLDDTQEDATLPPLGSRVVRGPDFRCQDHDVFGPGTITKHDQGRKHVWVHWDLSNVECHSRYGDLGYYDVIVVDDQPRILTEDFFMDIGIRVSRGPDWKYGDQDGGAGNTGVVIKLRRDLKVKVKWDNGGVFRYKYGHNGIFEVMVWDPETVKTSTTFRGHSGKQGNKTANNKPVEIVEATSDKPHVVWMWLDDGETWRMYTREQMDKLETEFRRKPTGTCVIHRDGLGYRVVFKSPMSEKSVGKTVVRHPVKRVAVSEEELKSMKT